jgi:transposase
MGNQKGIKRDFNGMEQRRFRAAELFERSYTRAEVARMLDVSFVSARRWYIAWQAGGPQRLKKAGRAGRRPKLTPAQIEQIEAVLSRQSSGELLARRLTSRRVWSVIKNITGISYHPESVSRLIRRFGWTSYRDLSVPNNTGEYYPTEATARIRSGTIEIDGGVAICAA